MSAWFYYAVGAAVLYGAHQIFTKLAAERISDGLGGFVVEASAAPGSGQADGPGEQWLTVHVEPSRASEVNRLLAESRIFASGLESGTDLELLFLELTGGEASSEGRMQGIDAPGASAS